MILLALLAVAAAPTPETRVRVIAHRGAHEEAPENTLAAVRAALAAR